MNVRRQECYRQRHPIHDTVPIVGISRPHLIFLFEGSRRVREIASSFELRVRGVGKTRNAESLPIQLKWMQYPNTRIWTVWFGVVHRKVQSNQCAMRPIEQPCRYAYVLH